MLSDLLQGTEIDIHASTPQLSGNQLRVLSHQTLIEHRDSDDSAGSLSVRCQRSDRAQKTCPTITAATAENRVIPNAVKGFWPCATATVVITPAPRQAAANWVVISEGRFNSGTSDVSGTYGGRMSSSRVRGEDCYAASGFVTARNDAGLARPALAHCLRPSICSLAVRERGTS